MALGYQIFMHFLFISHNFATPKEIIYAFKTTAGYICNDVGTGAA